MDHSLVFNLCKHLNRDLNHKIRELDFHFLKERSIVLSVLSESFDLCQVYDDTYYKHSDRVCP